MVAFDNFLGLYAFVSLVPFILIYLIKPKPKELTIPSLMFIVQQTGAKHLSNFLRNFFRDILFLIQLLTILLLAVSIAEPFIEVSELVDAENSVIVIDSSASVASVFGDIKSKAKDSLGRETTIILAENTPLIVLEKVSKNDARRVISSLSPRATTSNIGEAINLAGEMIEKGKIVVISDFISTEGPDPFIAKGAAESKGNVVEFIDVGKNLNNLAIIDIQVGKVSTVIYFKNYYEDTQTVNVRIGSLEKSLEIDSKSIETIIIETPPGITKIEILNNDDLKIDNVGYISTPNKDSIKVLLVTESKSTFLKSALSASPKVQVEVAVPPIIPKAENYDLVVFEKFDIDRLLPGTYENVRDAVKKGASVVFTAQEKMPNTNLIPVELGELSGATDVKVSIINALTRDVEFGRSGKHWNTTKKPDTIVLAKGEDGSPLIVTKTLDQGNTVFYGIFDSENDFKYSPSYPIFWNNLIGILTKTADLKEYNFRTGTLVGFSTPQKIKTPRGEVRTSSLILDEIGIYDFGSKKIAVNLLSDKESSVVKSAYETSRAKQLISESKAKVKKPLATYLLMAALFLILFEIYFIKRRGDL